MKKQGFAVLAVLAVICLFGGDLRAAETYPDPLAVGKIYSKVFENDKLRVSEITFKPGDTMPMHTHAYDHMLYILEAGQLTISTPDGKKTVVDATVGQTMWMGKETHTATNTGKTQFKALIVEVK
jgi:quercetin dioxygenase-like cupin family protein